MILGYSGGIELIPNNGKCDHDAKMDQFADTFEERIDAKANIVDDHLKPGEP